MEGPQGPQAQEPSEDEVDVDGSQPQQQNILQNTTPLFLQHCFYLGKKNKY
jgi:hypothetical protein